MLLIYGYAIRLETKNIPLSVQDFGHSPLSRTYVERIVCDASIYSHTPRWAIARSLILKGVAIDLLLTHIIFILFCNCLTDSEY